MVHCSDGLGVGVNVAATAKSCDDDGGGSATTRMPTIVKREEERNFMAIPILIVDVFMVMG